MADIEARDRLLGDAITTSSLEGRSQVGPVTVHTRACLLQS